MTTFKDFFQWYNNKDVFPTLDAMQKMVQFYHEKEIDMLKLCCTLLNLAIICLHKSTYKKFYTFCESDRDLCEKIREHMTGGHQLCLREKLLWIKPLSGIHQMSANQLLELMRASFIPIQCFNTYQQDCTQDGSLIPIFKNSRLDITDLAILRTFWSCLNTKKTDQKAELRASTHLEIKRKLTVSMLMDIAITTKQCLKQWGAINIFVLAKRLVPHLAMKILREETKGERWMT